MAAASPSQIVPASTVPLLPFGPKARAASVPLVFGASNAAGGVTVNVQALPPGQALGQIATIFADNTQNPLPLVLTLTDTGQAITVPAYTQGSYPVVTVSQFLTAAVPLLPYLTAQQAGFTVPVTLQLLNVPLAPLETTQPPAAAAAGAVAQVGTGGLWSTWNGTAPGNNLVHTALQLDGNTSGQQMTISGTDIFGNAWSVQQAGQNSSEIRIPPTLSGTAITVAVGNGGSISTLLGLIFRPIPAENNSGVVSVQIGTAQTASGVAIADTLNNATRATVEAISGTGCLAVGSQLLNPAGSGMVEHARSASAGNNVAATGLPADVLYGQYKAAAPVLTDGNYGALQLDSSGRVQVAPLPGGANTIGNVGISGALPAGANKIGSVDIADPLPAGANTIGNVGISGALPAGTNNIGTVSTMEATASSLNITAAKVVKAAPGTVARISVVVAGTAAGTVNDCLTTGAAAAANQVASVPNQVGVITLNWPCLTGIVVTPGSGQTLAVSFA